jgi:pantetheine-phosphate adenylyltransferase
MKAVYPGSFYPMTWGHVDIARRAARIFDELVVSVGVNPGKQGLLSPEQRVTAIRASLGQELRNVTVEAFSGLLVHHAASLGARWIVRGMRNASDFDYEYAMASTNHDLAPDLDTLFLAPAPRWSHLSSRLVREAALGGGNLEELVPGPVAEVLRQVLQQRGAG